VRGKGRSGRAGGIREKEQKGKPYRERGRLGVNLMTWEFQSIKMEGHL